MASVRRLSCSAARDPARAIAARAKLWNWPLLMSSTYAHSPQHPDVAASGVLPLRNAVFVLALLTMMSHESSVCLVSSTCQASRAMRLCHCHGRGTRHHGGGQSGERRTSGAKSVGLNITLPPRTIPKRRYITPDLCFPISLFCAGARCISCSVPGLWSFSPEDSAHSTNCLNADPSSNR